MSDLKELWRRFDNEFLQALAHHYNAEDEAEFIKPLRDAIMGEDYRIEDLRKYVFGFEVRRSLDETTYRVSYNGQHLFRVVKYDDIARHIKDWIRKQDADYHGPTAEQFEEGWYRK